MESTDTKKIIEKIKSGAYSNCEPKKVEKNKSTKNPLSESAKAELKAIVQESNREINKNAADEPKAPDATGEPAKVAKAEKAVEPAEPKVAHFPVESHINKYGFLGFGVGLINALGLTLFQGTHKKGESRQRLTADVSITFVNYDAATKILTVKIEQ